jgi:MOSC domain-containing protein YiiM
MQGVQRVQVVPDMGVQGDRYFGRGGTAAITLIEREVLDAVADDVGVQLEFSATRRNVLTSGVALNDLVGREFRLGDAVLRGVEVCEPCWHVTGDNTAVLRSLVHRGGLRAEILTGGAIDVGAIIESAAERIREGVVM